MQREFYRCVRFLPWWKTGGSSVRKSHSQLEGSVLCCKCGRFKTKIRVQVLLTSSQRCVSVLIGTENRHSSAAVAAAALIRSDGCPLEVIVKTYSLKIAHIFIWLWGVSLNITELQRQTDDPLSANYHDHKATGWTVAPPSFNQMVIFLFWKK